MDISRLYMVALICLTLPCCICSNQTTTQVPRVSTATATPGTTTLTSHIKQTASHKPDNTAPPTTIQPETKQDNLTTAIQPETKQDNLTTTIEPVTEQDNLTTTIQPVTEQDNKTATIQPVTEQDNKTTTIQPVTEQDNKTATIQPVTEQDNKTATIQPVTKHDNKTATMQPVTEQDNKTTTIQPVTEQDNKTATIQPVTEQDNKTATIQPVTKQDNKTATMQPVTEQDNKTTTIQPVTEQDNKTATIQPVTEQDNKTATIQPVTKHDNKTTTIQPVTKQDNKTKTILPATKEDNKTATTQPPTTKQSTAAIPSSGDEIVYINEIVVDKSGGFREIELQLSKQLDVTHYAMVMVDGTTNKSMSVVYLKDMIQQDNDLLIFTFNSSQPVPNMKEKGTGVAIYDTSKMNMATDGTVNEAGLVDALVIGKTYTGVSEHLTNMLTPGVNPFILDPNKFGVSETISRCSPDQLRNTDMFALIYPSFGKDNKQKCDEGLAIRSDFAVKIKDIDCKTLEETNKTVSKSQLTVKFLINYIVKQVNTECQCGVTGTNIIDPIVHCCDGASVDMRFVSSSKDQLKDLKESFRSFIQSTQYINVHNHLYSLDSGCYENCCGVQKGTGDDKTKNVKVTVAVIVSCLVVFMIILGIVVMYMRKKKGAVYQFRMSRLDEEEDDLVADGPNHDEFVGGQEATFDMKCR